MDWNDRDEVFHMIRKELGEVIPYKYCPVCKDRMPMIRFRKFANINETEGIANRWFSSIPEYVGFRCVGCLKLFTEGLKETE